MNLPLLDHDLAPEAITKPGRHIQPRDVPEHCVICFFHDVLNKVISEHKGHCLFLGVTSLSDVGAESLCKFEGQLWWESDNLPESAVEILMNQ